MSANCLLFSLPKLASHLGSYFHCLLSAGVTSVKAFQPLSSFFGHWHGDLLWWFCHFCSHQPGHFSFLAWLSFCPLSTSQKGLNSMFNVFPCRIHWYHIHILTESPCLGKLTLLQGHLKTYFFFYFWVYNTIISFLPSPFSLPTLPYTPPYSFSNFSLVVVIWISVCVYTNIFLTCLVCIMLFLCMFSGYLVLDNQLVNSEVVWGCLWK